MGHPTRPAEPGGVTLTYAEADALCATLAYAAGYCEDHAADVAAALRAHLVVLRQRQAAPAAS